MRPALFSTSLLSESPLNAAPRPINKKNRKNWKSVVYECKGIPLCK
jgi:hypothetical protein